jgi:hypothetical protein
MNIEELIFKPNTLYAIRGGNPSDTTNTIRELAKQGRVNGCTFIFLQEGERIEEMSLDRLSELGLARVRHNERAEKE